MRKAVNPCLMAQSPQQKTFNVTRVSSSALGCGRGVQLPPLMAQGKIRPEHVANIRFRLVEVDAQPLSDPQFNALIKRLVKCFMSEVEITKRLRKLASRKSFLPANKQLIQHMEALRRNYESERSGLVLQLSRDHRFCPLTPQYEEKTSGKFCKVRKSISLDVISRSSNEPETTEDQDACSSSRHRQSGGLQPIICNRIEPPASLTKKLREKLCRLEEIAKYRAELSTSDEAEAQSSSSDLFYDMDNY